MQQTTQVLINGIIFPLDINSCSHNIEKKAKRIFKVLPIFYDFIIKQLKLDYKSSKENWEQLIKLEYLLMKGKHFICYLLIKVYFIFIPNLLVIFFTSNTCVPN